jgi:hypothetical protein
MGQHCDFQVHAAEDARPQGTKLTAGRTARLAEPHLQALQRQGVGGGGPSWTMAGVALDFSHSDTTLYISLVVLYTKYTGGGGGQHNDFNVYT